MTPHVDQRPTVLVVDDVAETRRLIVDFVHRRGYDTLEASDGKTALAQLRLHRHAVCAIILDLQMAGMNGFTFRAKQLADSELADVPVIVVTSSGRSEILAYSLRVERIVYKPMIADQLAEALEHHCAGAGQSIPSPR